MQKKKWVLIAAAAGVLATTATVGASGMLQKVSGLIRNDYQITVNGENTSLTPVFINGQAYLPVRGAADALGYELRYDGRGKEIALTDRSTQPEAEYRKMSGIIVDVQPAGNSSIRIELLGRGEDNWMILFADAKTELTDADGKKLAAEQLKAGTEITADYGPIVALSYPGQSHAAKIAVIQDRLIKEDVIQTVQHTDDGWQIVFGDTKDGQTTTTLKLNAGKETSILTADGQPVAWESLKSGDRVRAYYGPIMTKSIPPISPLFYLVVLPKQDERLEPTAAQQFRDLAWNQMSDEEKSHLTTAKNDAEVRVVLANDSAAWPSTDEGKRRLEELKAANAKLVTVSFHTDQDEILGPLTAAFELETKVFIGYYIRK